MMTDGYFERAFEVVPVMGIFRSQGLDKTIRLAEAAWNAGVRVVEVTIQMPEDLLVLREIVVRARERGLDVGAGTVVTVDQAAAAAEAGARFTVAPGFDPEVADASLALGMPHVPGIATASEIEAALKHGLTWLKAFPAEALGASWIKHQRGPFPAAHFVASGGITPETASSFLEAGCRVVALGSAFGSEAQIAKLTPLLR